MKVTWRLPDEDAAIRLAGDGARILATIWATVDLDRTLRTIGLSAGDATATTAAIEDTLLGARVVIVDERPDDPLLAIAEPTTEGPLAAFLARNGEGPAGRYIAVVDDLDPVTARAALAGITVSGVGAGPFGPALLVRLGAVTGPYLILCDPRAVPSRP